VKQLQQQCSDWQQPSSTAAKDRNIIKANNQLLKMEALPGSIKPAM